MRTCIWASACMLLFAGCGQSNVDVAFPVKTALEQLELELNDVRQAFKEQAEPQVQGGDEEMVDQDRGSSSSQGMRIPPLQGIVGSAQDLAAAAAGKTIESEAKAILDEAQKLQDKSAPGGNASEIRSGIEQLQSKVAVLKGKL